MSGQAEIEDMFEDAEFSLQAEDLQERQRIRTRWNRRRRMQKRPRRLDWNMQRV